MNEVTLSRLLERLSELRIAVVGDFFLDKYLMIDTELSEVSVETGLEAYQVVEKRTSPGAAGTVVSNLSALGVGTIHAVGVLGVDGEGFELRQNFGEKGVLTEHLIGVPSWVTPTYTKPMKIRGDELPLEMSRLDIKNLSPTPQEVQREIIEGLESMISCLDGVIILDQLTERNCGVITEDVRSAVELLSRRHPDKVILVDSRAHIGEFQSVIIKVNQSEAVAAVRPDHSGEVSIELSRQCTEDLAAASGKPVFLTLGAEGIALLENGYWSQHPTLEVEGPIDIVGAGDSASAGIVSALCARSSFEEAAILGNMVASITIQQVGRTGTASPDQVRSRFEDFRGILRA